MRAALAVAVAALVLAGAVAVGSAIAAAGDVDTSFATGGESVIPLGPGARASAVALAPEGRLVVAGDIRGPGGEKVVTARFLPNGALDRSFASTGARVDVFGSGEPQQRAGAVLAQPDGGVLVAAAAGDQLALARFLPDGLADGLFGAGGVALRDPSDGGGLPSGTGPAAMATTATGQIVVAGSVGVTTDDYEPGEQIVVARYSDRGVPDPSFGRDGFTVFQLGAASPRAHAASAARALVVLADGRIVIAGRATDRAGAQRAFVARLTAAGRLDTSFARGGRLLVQLGRASVHRAASSHLDALTLLGGDDSVLATGSATDVAGNDAVALAHVTVGGALDPGFGRGGSTLMQLGSASEAAIPRSAAHALALQPDGAVLVAGGATGGAFAARVFASTGRLDCGFGRSGRTLAFGGGSGGALDPATDGAAAAVLQPGIGLVLAGRRAGGGVLLGRLNTTQPSAAPLAPRLVTLAPRYRGKGRGYVYGLLDGGCRSRAVRFEITQPNGHTIRTVAQRVPTAGGPQVFCAPLRGLRPGAKYGVRAVSVATGGPRGARRVLRALASGARSLPQEGCV
jgi:uncharacterized delta-60 repeat protein